jgi:hypothetical protein
MIIINIVYLYNIIIINKNCKSKVTEDIFIQPKKKIKIFSKKFVCNYEVLIF